MNPVFTALSQLTGPALLATVVRIDGSAYRREGARMLIQPDGALTGMLSGGCLEDDVREASRPLFDSGESMLLSYDLRGDDESVWGLNMGCNGLIDVLVEPVTSGLIGAARTYLEGQPIHLEAIHDGRVIYAETVNPPPLFWVVGAGADAPPLVSAAVLAGWRVRVVDRRPKYADPDRFPQAEQVLHIQPDELPERAGAGAYAIFMHHNFDHDREYLTAMLGTGAAYLGVLGPLKRTAKLLGSDELPSAVFAPVGLDLGGDGPEAVALSIVAEIQAVRHGRSGGHLRGRSVPLHA